MKESRTRKSLLNAKVNLIFYALTLVLTFFSRKIFLDCLGDDFVGLTSSLQNLLGFLNLAELGIGASIGYVLYKPLFDRDHQRINEIISVFGYLYQWVGWIILILGCILSIFLPFIFPDTKFGSGVIYAVYYAFLASSLIGYFINYKQTLLGADQRNYVIVGYFQTCNIVKTLIQMVSVWYTRNYYLWIAVEFCFGIIYSFVLNWRIKVTYPWLATELSKGKEMIKRYGIIITKSKQLFIHKLAGVARYQLLPFLIYIYSSLEVVAHYGNYTIIVDKVAGLVENLMGSTQAGVGNLIAEGGQNKIMSVYWELNTIRYLIATICVFSIYHLINPFIRLWVGAQYIMEKDVIVLVLVNTFFVLTRGTNDQFIYGYGLFQDTWAPLASLVMTVVLGISLGCMMGLKGVLLGNVIGLAIMLCLWKPYFLYSRGFKLKLSSYWVGILRIIFPAVIASLAASYCLNSMEIHSDSFVEWIVLGFVSVSMISFMYVGLLLVFNRKYTILVIRRARKLFS